MDDNRDFLRYLRAKVSVDDRALNREVWSQFINELLQKSQKHRLKILEVGGGFGSMFTRLLQQAQLEHLEYSLVDADPHTLNAAPTYIADWCRNNDWNIVEISPKIFELEKAGSRIVLKLVQADIYDLEKIAGGWDVVIAHQLLDLLNLDAAVAKLFDLLTKEGIFYFSSNYDGETIFKPAIDPDLDELITRLYNQDMDHRRTANGEVTGGSQSGRKLGELLKQREAKIIAEGESCWNVKPEKGAYLQDEAYFLEYIVGTVRLALQDSQDVNELEFEGWNAKRRDQILKQVLHLKVRHIDFVGQIA